VKRAWWVSALWLVACGSGARDAEDAGGAPADGGMIVPFDAAEELPREDAAQPRDARASAEDASADAAADDAGDDEDAEALPLALCPMSARVAEGCVDSEGSTDCDGLDNDCDGVIDEQCPCVPGSVQACFGGPPGRADTGACGRGTQTCLGGEFPSWGPCTGDTRPSTESCNASDDDCNGCTDELSACIPVVECPEPGDPRIPSGRPFEAIALDATRFAPAHEITSARWTVEGSPCDRMFAAIPGSPASQDNGLLSYTVSGASSSSASLRPTLSGSYAVTLSLGLRDGSTTACRFPVQVRSEGLRVELCWDATGPTAGTQPVDLDLHLAKRGATARWFDARDCDYATCVPQDLVSRGIWGDPNTAELARCLTGGPLDVIHQLRGNCPNPRLDLDNQGETRRYLPENINHDVPATGDTFEIAVNHRSMSARRTAALVNVYCGGTLSGSFPLAQSAGFSDATGKLELWRVADVVVDAPSAAGETRCHVSPLTAIDHPHAPDLVDGDTRLRFSP
jgi:hypothetical protein